MLIKCTIVSQSAKVAFTFLSDLVPNNVLRCINNNIGYFLTKAIILIKHIYVALLKLLAFYHSFSGNKQISEQQVLLKKVWREQELNPGLLDRDSSTTNTAQPCPYPRNSIISLSIEL